MRKYHRELPNTPFMRWFTTYIFPMVNGVLVAVFLTLTLVRFSILPDHGAEPDPVLLRWIAGVAFVVVYLLQVRILRRYYESRKSPAVYR